MDKAMTATACKRSWPKRRTCWALGIATLAACAATAGWFWRGEMQRLSSSVLAGHLFVSDERMQSSTSHGDSDEGEDDHAEHDQESHPGETDEPGHASTAVDDHQHKDADAIQLGEQARKNIGVRLLQVELRSFERTITVPGIVVERPGWTVVEVTSPMTGVVTRIYPIQGQAVRTGQPLFEVRLTHEDLLQKQTDFLRSVEELDVIGREVARLEKIAADGSIAGKTLLERKYEQQKQEAALRVQRQALLLHGLSHEQIEEIQNRRTLLQSLSVFVPEHENGSETPEERKLFQVQQMSVSQGSYVTAGTSLCRLVDHAALYIEGSAFEEDVQAISNFAAQGGKMTAYVGSKTDSTADAIPDLRILYLDDQVNPETRAFRFYVALPNHVVRQDTSPDGRQFVYWRFKPGQRMQIKVPVEKWLDRIVLPAEAVARDGPNLYVFELNGDHFDRRAVHVEYTDPDWVVIANDGALKPGIQVATSAAHQMQLALKNKAGGAVDPHAGHGH